MPDFHPRPVQEFERKDVCSVLAELEPYIEKASKRISSNLPTLEASDLAQEAMLKLLKIVKGREEMNISYFKRVSVNAMLDAYTAVKESNGFSWDDLLVEAQSAGTDVSRIAKVSIASWITRLPHDLREIYQLVYVHGFTQREAATRLQVSQSWIAQLHSRLINKGRRELASFNN